MPALRYKFPEPWQVSAALFLLVLGATALSFRYRLAAHWTAQSERTYWRCSLVLGRLVVVHQRDEIPDQPFRGSGWLFEFQRIPAFNEISDAASDDPSRIHFRFAGLMHLDGNAPDFVSDSLYVPLWLPLLVFAIVPALVAYRRVRARRTARRGLCAKCAYDLRASTGRCPECGTPIDQAEPAEPDARQVHI